MSRAVFQQNVKFALVEFSEAISKPVNTTLLKMTLTDDVEGKVLVCTNQLCPVSYTANGIQIGLLFDNTVIKGTFKIELADATAKPILNKDKTLPFLDYPLIVKEVHFEGSNPPTAVKVTKSIGTGAKSTIQTIRSTAAISITFARPMSSMALDRLVAEFMYLKLVDGPFLYYPDAFLKLISDSSMLPVDVPNLFSPGSPVSLGLTIHHDERCQVPATYQKQGYKCNILANYGSDLVVLAGYLLLGVLITVLLIWFMFRPKMASQKPEDWGWGRKLVNVLARSYGLKYFMAKMDGISLELLIFSALNIAKFIIYDSVGIAGLAISAAIVVYFLIYTGLLVKVSKDISSLRCQNPKPSESPDEQVSIFFRRHQGFFN